jgi:hypothetical protein
MSYRDQCNRGAKFVDETYITERARFFGILAETAHQMAVLKPVAVSLWDS